MPYPPLAQALTDTRSKSITPQILKYFLLYFLLLVLFLTSINLPIYLQYENSVQERLLAQDEASIVSATQMFQKEMYEQLHLLDMLVNSFSLKEYLTEGTAEQRFRLEKTFENISTSFHRFDQIRLLDHSGQEQIRVDLKGDKGALVPSEELQNKAHRYYFKATKQLPLGQVYVSAMNLNRERNTIEQPYKPTLRFATAVEDSQGNPAGILIMNYLAKGMLDRFRELMTQRFENQGMLVDAEGYWLSSRQLIREWGADLNKPEQNMSVIYPDLWSEIRQNKTGVFEAKDGLYRYHSIEPLNFTDSKPAHFRMEHHPLIPDESYTNTDWKIVIFLPRELINSHTFLYQPLGQALFGIFILLIASLAFLAAFSTVQRQLRKEKEQHALALLEQQASIDELTGINNRRHFYELGEAEVKRALRQKSTLAALMIDADHFKKVNDTYGHAVGDLVLKDLTKTIANTLRDLDLLGRVGGEEFAVLLPSTNLTQAKEVAERLRLALAACKVATPDDGILRFTVSIGLAMLTNQDQQLDKLLQKADQALYLAKEQGRNRVVVY